MISTIRSAATALAAGLLLAGCGDFLTQGEAGNDPNRPVAATARQLFVGVQANLASQVGSDPQRLSAILTQQFEGVGAQYVAVGQSYSLDENTTNGFFSSVYGPGGLIDIRRIQEQSAAVSDSLFTGIALVHEAALIGTAADLFGDIVYSQAYQGANPALDEQLAVYDAVQQVLDRAIVQLAAAGPTNIGPGSADLAFCTAACGTNPTAAQRANQRARWTAVARTLKARFLLHTAEVRPTVYAEVLTQARQGIRDAEGSYVFEFSGNSGEQNFLANFNVNERPGYFVPDPFFVDLLEDRNDPRRTRFFNADASDLSAGFNSLSAPLPIVTAEENLLIQAEAAQRTGSITEAQQALAAEQAIQDVTTANTGATGLDLLREILTEKYIALFPSIEVWNDYRRTCFPNLAPRNATRRIPARLFYDTGERQTNTSIPQAQEQPTRNDNDPANATDPFGNACLGQ